MLFKTRLPRGCITSKQDLLVAAGLEPLPFKLVDGRHECWLDACGALWFLACGADDAATHSYLQLGCGTADSLSTSNKHFMSCPVLQLLEWPCTLVPHLCSGLFRATIR